MSGREKYLLDSDSLIRSKREHYAFDFCPGFWDALVDCHHQAKVYSIEPVRKELLAGKDALADWAREQAPDTFFEAIDDATVQGMYAKIIQWVEDHKRYSRPAKQRFIKSVDPWLIAFSCTNNFLLTTYEVSAPDSLSIIKIPDVAKHFKVTCIPPYVMLRRLQVILVLGRDERE